MAANKVPGKSAAKQGAKGSTVKANATSSKKAGPVKSAAHAVAAKRQPVAAVPKGGAAKPAPAKAAAAKAKPAQPQARPVARKPEPAKAAPARPAAVKPAAKSPVAKAPVTKAPAAKSPAGKTPAPKAPVAKAPAPVMAKAAPAKAPLAASPLTGKASEGRAPESRPSIAPKAPAAPVVKAAVAAPIGVPPAAAGRPAAPPAGPARPLAPRIEAPRDVAARTADKAALAKEEAKKRNTQRHGFRTNEYVVYPSHGVGRIVAIEEQVVAGHSLELFVINFEQEKMTLRVPTAKLQAVGMRKLAEDSIVRRAMETLKGRARIKRTMWSRRAQEYESKINSGDLVSISEVVRDLYRAESQPEQSYSERQLFEAALDRMSREIAAIEKLDERGAVQKIVDVLSKSARGRAKAAEDAAGAGGPAGAEQAA